MTSPKRSSSILEGVCAGSSKGRTAGSGPVNLGSNPSPAAPETRYPCGSAFYEDATTAASAATAVAYPARVAAFVQPSTVATMDANVTSGRPGCWVLRPLRPSRATPVLARATVARTVAQARDVIERPNRPAPSPSRQSLLRPLPHGCVMLS